MIDSHSHLFEEEFNNDLDDCIKRCKENNVNKIILVGFSYDTNRLAQKLSKEYDIFYPTAGIHPDEADNNYLEKINELKEFVSNNKVYAIGECGIDYHYTKENADIQKIIFRAQIELSIEKNLPLIIHMRDATLDTFNILKEYKGKIKGVMHCYSGSLEMAYEFIKLGFHISLGGPVTFKNAKEPKEVAKNIPLDKLLVETDCPFLAPTPYRGKRNESSYVTLVAKEIAALRGISYEELEYATEKNTKELFNL
jgi:TatD DNase family protein